MPTDWDQWNRTAAILAAMRYRSQEIKRNIGELTIILDAMQQRPCFETEAEAALKSLETDMQLALASIRALEDQYKQIAAVA